MASGIAYFPADISGDPVWVIVVSITAPTHPHVLKGTT